MTIQKLLPSLLSISRVPIGMAFLLLITRDTVPTTLLATGLTCISLVTDYLDGRLARSTGSVTLAGKWIDPFCDFTFFFFVYYGFHRLGLMPLALLLAFLARELMMYLLIRPLYMVRKLDPAAKMPGKIKTVLQITGSLIVLLLLLLSQAQVLSEQALRTAALYILLLLVAASLGSLYWYVKPLVQGRSR